MRKIFILLSFLYFVSNTYAKRVSTCFGIGMNDVIVAKIDEDSNDKVMMLKGAGDLTEASVFVTVVVKHPNGYIHRSLLQ